jgi:hypothetical protein
MWLLIHKQPATSSFLLLHLFLSISSFLGPRSLRLLLTNRCGLPYRLLGSFVLSLLRFNLGETQPNLFHQVWNVSPLSCDRLLRLDAGAHLGIDNLLYPLLV